MEDVIAAARAVAVSLAAVIAASSIVGASDSPWGADYFPNVTLTTHHGTRVRFRSTVRKCPTAAVSTPRFPT